MILSSVGLNILYAQKEDNTWVLGYGSDNYCVKPACQTRIQFNDDSTTTVSWHAVDAAITRTNSSICDSNGSLKYFTNGFTLFGAFDDTLQNGDSISYGSYYDYFEGQFQFNWYEALLLNVPGKNDNYILFHSSVNADASNSNFNNKPDSLTLYSEINNNYVQEKNTSITTEYTSANSWSAVKHANGRDWWIVKFAEDPKFIWRILLTPQGIKEVVKVELNYNLGFNKSWGSPIKFSGLGDKMVAYFWSTPQVIFECSFDRCNGSFSNEKTTSVLSLLQNNYPMFQTLYNQFDPDYKPERFFFGGLELSPNGRFLYLSFYVLLYQFDLEKENWIDDPYLVDEVIIYNDSTPLDIYYSYITMQNGPNGKVYINQGNLSLAMAVINAPNKQGAACNFKRDDLQLYSRNGGGLPTFPNFRLGPIDGSSCDSLGLTNTYNPEPPEKPVLPFEIKVYPNPNNGVLTVGINQEGNYNLKVFNAIGQLVLKNVIGIGNTEINLTARGVSTGLYFLEISNEQQQRLKIEKIVVTHD